MGPPLNRCFSKTLGSLKMEMSSQMLAQTDTDLVANSASQNTKSQGCTSSTPSSDSRDTSLARRRTSSRRASARTSSPPSSTSTAAPRMTRSGSDVVVFIHPFPTLWTIAFFGISQYPRHVFPRSCPRAAVKSNKSSHWEWVLNQQTAAFI